MSWQGKNILVTGAGGFIGSHLAERLVREGAQVRAMVHYNALGKRGWLDFSPHVDQMEIFPGDICDRDSVNAAMKGIQVVFHLAALIAIPYSYQAPGSYVGTNVMGTLNVLQSSLGNEVDRVVHTSTSEVYGTAAYVPIDESHPLQAQSPYAASKIGADKIAESFHHSFGVPVVTVRPFNTYGPRQSNRAIVPTVITQCLGSDTVRVGNLHPTRDLNFIEDTVNGFLLAASEPEAVGVTINLGSGTEISIGGLVEMISRILGKQMNTIHEEERVRPEGSEVERLLADNSLARSLIKWESRVDLEAGLTETIRWYEANMELFRAAEYVV